jgi:hypothetical protein
VSDFVAEETAELLSEPIAVDGIDATIAIRADATLATANVPDFRRFAAYGLTTRAQSLGADAGRIVGSTNGPRGPCSLSQAC